MRLRCRLIGEGTELSPYGVSLPTYSVVEVDYLNLLAVVDVPDRDVQYWVAREEPPNDMPHLTEWRGELLARDLPADPEVAALVPKPELRPLAADTLELWHNHLDRRYVEHAGEFRPEIA